MKGYARYECFAIAAVLSAALLSGCAHEQTPAAATPDLFWPPPPARPEARYLGALPDALMTKPQRSFWEKVWDAFIGAKPEPERSGGALARPFGVAARGDVLFVADPGAHQVLRLEWRNHAIKPVQCEGRAWSEPMAITSGPDGAVYVADAGAGAIVRIEASGACRAIGTGVLKRPTGVVVATGRIYAVDPPSHAVIAFSMQGREVLRFGGRGEKNGELNFPTGIAARGDGALFVVDSLNFRIVTFTADGRYIGSFGEAGDGGGAFGRPKAVTLDERGRIFVSDTRNDVVIVFGADGAFDFAIGGSGTEPGQLTLPAGVAVSGDMLFVADSYNRRVAAYQLLGGER